MLTFLVGIDLISTEGLRPPEPITLTLRELTFVGIDLINTEGLRLRRRIA